METTNALVLKKTKRPKSATRYPKRMNTFVVAYAVKETFNDITNNATASENSKNIFPSGESVSVTGSATSTKTFTITTANELPHPFIPTISEVKIDMLDGNQGGDEEMGYSQANNYPVIYNNKADDNITRNMKTCQEHQARKKAKYCTPVVKLKNDFCFKHKKSKNNITRKLQKFYLKQKINYRTLGKIHKIYFKSLTKIVSKRILKKVLVKEISLKEADQISMFGTCSLNESENSSVDYTVLNSTSPNESGQNTLVNNSFYSLRSDGFYSIKTANSRLSVLPKTTSHNTDTINVALAVAFTPVKLNSNEPTISSNDEFSPKENIISTISFTQNELTSQVPSEDSPKSSLCNIDQSKLNEKEMSTETLTGSEKKSLKSLSDDDTFVFARTSSDLNKSSISETMMITDSPIKNNMHNIEEIALFNNVSQRTTLLGDVMNLGLYPEVRPSTSSRDQVEIEKKNDYKRHKVRSGLTRNILKKPIEIQYKDQHNNIRLPNEKVIKAILEDADKTHKKTHSEDAENIKFPSDFAEMWKRLTLSLDEVMNRLESRLAETIIKEINKSLALFHVQRKDETINSNDPLIRMNNQELKKDNCVQGPKKMLGGQENAKTEIDRGLQCHLVQNQMIDQLMLKLSVERPKTLTSPKVSLKQLKEPQLIRHYFDVLKPHALDMEFGKGDMVTVSTGTTRELSKRCLHRVGRMIRSPFLFIRENIVVLASVPSFFLLLLCLYVVITGLVKP